MSLQERLAQAGGTARPSSRSGRRGSSGRPQPASRSGPGGTGPRPVRRPQAPGPPALLDTLGPKLYDARLTQTDMEQKVRQTLQEVLSAGEMPLTSADRAPHRPGDLRRHPRLRADRAVPARPDITEIMVNGPDQIFVERGRPDPSRGGPVRGRGAPAAHDRQDRRQGGAARRRGQPDGRRPPAGRQPHQRDHPAARRRRLAAHHPQVRHRSAHGRRPDLASAR